MSGIKVLTQAEFEKVLEEAKTNSDIEVRYYCESGLVCPYPVKDWKMNRSYADMRAEYDLLHAGEFTEEEKALIELRIRMLTATAFPTWGFAIFPVLMLLGLVFFLAWLKQ